MSNAAIHSMDHDEIMELLRDAPECFWNDHGFSSWNEAYDQWKEHPPAKRGSG